MKGSGVIPGDSLPGSTSASLIARLKNRDRDAWAKLAAIYGPLVYAWCRRRGLQEQDAADVSQEVFRAVAMSIDRFEHGPGRTFRGWLWTITRSKIIDHFRRVQARPEAVGGSDVQDRLAQLPESLDDSDAGPSTLGGLVRRGLDQIRPDFKEKTWQAFCRVAMDSEAPADVAKDLGLSVNAVLIAKSRVLARLREVLGDDFS